MIQKEDFIVLPQSLRERFIATVKERSPVKSFGYFLSKGVGGAPSDFVLLENNIRNSEDWKGKFQAYGRYFVEHDDAGFVATPEEAWRLQKEIWARNMVEVGVFHSHLRHPANFSQIDYEMHIQRFPNLWHMTISMRNPDLPQLRAFAVSNDGVRELQVVSVQVEDESPAEHSLPDAADRDRVITRAQQMLSLDDKGRPLCKDYMAIYMAVNALLRTEDYGAIEELLTRGFLRDSVQRYEEYVAPNMSHLDGGFFQMGTDQSRVRHFCGEVPRHTIELSPFNISQVQVTNEMFSLLDKRRLDVSVEERQKPAVDVTWFDAAVLAMWMGCRLPTEAEWEFACGAGSEDEWCCGDESLLPRYAWFSENSGGEAHIVGTREANLFGLFDLHGNVWEWCQDSYEQDYYSYSPVVDPVRVTSPVADRVCRGGSMHALSEMCRTSYRFHDPPIFCAKDLGFRLAKSSNAAPGEGENKWSNF